MLEGSSRSMIPRNWSRAQLLKAQILSPLAPQLLLLIVFLLAQPSIAEHGEREADWGKAVAGELSTISFPSSLSRLVTAHYPHPTVAGDIFSGFNQPWGLASGSEGVFVCDSQNHKLRVISNGTVHTVAGTGTPGLRDGEQGSAQFQGPKDVVLLEGEAAALVADEGNNCIRKVSLESGLVSTVVGGSKAGNLDGIGTVAEFHAPSGMLLVQGSSALLVADAQNNRLRLVELASATVTTIAGEGSAGFTDGFGTRAMFNYPVALTASTGNPGIAYVVDCYNHALRSLDLESQTVATVAVQGGALSFPMGILAIDLNGLLVADSYGFQVKRVSLSSGAVVALAGQNAGDKDGYGTSARFSQPTGLAWVGPGSGDIVVADTSNSKLKILSPLLPLTSQFCGEGRYLADGGVCRHCNNTMCSVGQYREVCSHDRDGQCFKCTNFLPSESSYSSTGVPFNVNNCSWQCNLGFVATTHCTSCSSASQKECVVDCLPLHMNNGSTCFHATETTVAIKIDQSIDSFVSADFSKVLTTALSVDPASLVLRVIDEGSNVVVVVRMLSSEWRSVYVKSIIQSARFKEMLLEFRFPVLAVTVDPLDSYSSPSDSGGVDQEGGSSGDPQSNHTDGPGSMPVMEVIADATTTSPWVISGALVGAIVATMCLIGFAWVYREWIMQRLEAYHQSLEDTESRVGETSRLSRGHSQSLDNSVLDDSVLARRNVEGPYLRPQHIEPVNSPATTSQASVLTDALEPTRLTSAIAPTRLPDSTGPSEATLPSGKQVESLLEPCQTIPNVSLAEDYLKITVRSPVSREVSFSEIEISESDPFCAGSRKSVWRASWRDGDAARPVLVLVMSSASDLERERGAFETVGKHAHLTQLIAISKFQMGGYDAVDCLLLESSALGCLDAVLQMQQRTGRLVSDLVAITICKQVHSAMVQLALHEVVHQDLAARNVLVFGFDAVDRSKVYVKLSLSLHGSITTGGEAQVPVPYRWMAPESIAEGVFSERSDVFQFGVLCWEIWSKGELPFKQVSSEEEIGVQIVKGRRLAFPQCPDRVWNMLQLCWRAQPAQRPKVIELGQWLDDAHVSIAANDIKALDRGHACVICLERPPVVALLPCGHKTLCDDEVCMGLKLHECPICRQAVEHRVRIYDP